MLDRNMNVSANNDAEWLNGSQDQNRLSGDQLR